MTGIIWSFALSSSLVLFSAWLATRLLAGASASADLRHRIWLAALTSLPLLILPIQIPAPVRIAAAASLSSASSTMLVPRNVSSFLLAVWAAGAGLFLARFVISLARLIRLTRAAYPTETSNILKSAAVKTPMTWGIVSPIILLPEYAFDWPAEQRERALRHELAHIERRDWLWQSFAQLLTGIFWLHPLVWFAASELRREADRAADDVVLASGVEASDYAAQLLDVAKRLHGSTPSLAVAMVRRPALESRLTAILDPARPRTRAGLGARASIIFGIVVLLASSALLQAAKIHKVGEAGLTPPKVASKTDPEYTPEARQAKIQGTTTLMAVINEKGQAEKIQVKKSLDPGLDQKAIEAVQKWRFEPGRMKGKAVAVAANIEINWHLK